MCYSMVLMELTEQSSPKLYDLTQSDSIICTIASQLQWQSWLQVVFYIYKQKQHNIYSVCGSTETTACVDGVFSGEHFKS